MGVMKACPRTYRVRRTDAVQRARLLAAFDRSGLSAAAFARQHRLNYTTFCGWRTRRAQSKPSAGFVQVELSGPAAPAGLVVELGGSARMRIESTSQIGLAAQLVQQLNTPRPC